MVNNNSNKDIVSTQPISTKEHICLRGLNIKEENEGDIVVQGIVASTHPDRVGDILSENALNEIAEHINDTAVIGGPQGASRSVSLFHDWVKANDPTLDEVAFLKPTARVVKLNDGHFGVEVDSVLNKHYRGEMSIDEVKYRIDNDQIAGFSIEYKPNPEKTHIVNHSGNEYRFIDGLSEFGGVGLARARMIANPHAVIYKEIAEQAMSKDTNEVKTMAEEEKKIDNIPKDDAKVETKVEQSAPEVKKEEVVESKEVETKEESEEKNDDKNKKDDELDKKELNMKEIELRVKEQILNELNVKNKVIKTTKEDEKKMEQKETLPLSIKEMNDAIKGEKIDLLSFKEAANKYFAEINVGDKISTSGIPLHSKLNVKCNGTKLQVVGGLEIKAPLDSTTNPGAYTEQPVEFADVFMPGLIDTFNNQTNLWGAIRKVDNVLGGNFYGFRIKTARASGSEADPNDPSVSFNPVKKLKLHTEIKERRLGVSVVDYTLYHSRAALGDLFMIEVQSVMNDMMKEANQDLFTEQTDTDGLKTLGLEAVADSVGNTSMYGKVRSTVNRLAPDSASDTYNAVGGAITTELIRGALRKVEVEGASRSDLRIIVNPKQRDALFELEDGNQNYFNAPKFGFEGQISYDGVQVIVDPDCPIDALFVVDFSSYYIVMSKAPQLTGLAKIGASESAYLNMYYAVVYEQPRRIHMLDTLA